MAHLLVADNSPFYRKLLADALGEQGHTVRTVPDGLEALQALQGERFDAVILDLVMPRLSGARACRQIKAQPAGRDLPVLILSGLREDEIDDADEIGADAYVAKMQAEAMVSHLTAALGELLAGDLRATCRGFDRMHRREVVSELLAERRSRDAILSSLSEGYLRVSGEGLVVEANPAAQAMLSRDESRLVGQALESVLGCGRAGSRDLLSGRAACLRIPVGDRVLEVRSRGASDSGRETFLLLGDVTVEERAAEERRHLQERVEASERLSALGEIVAGVAQELQSPLTGLLGYAELLLKVASDERSRARLDRLHHEAQRCRRVVENLLCFARKRQAYVRPQSLNEVVIKAIKDGEPAAAKAGVRLRTELAADLPTGMFDFGQMEQVLGNLLANAFQALAGLPEERREVLVRTGRGADGLFLEVADQGPGIEPSVRERVFEPFYTTRRPEGGTGLGLAVSYGIISQHGGRIRIGDAGPGACLRVELPVAADHDGRPAPGDGGRLPAVLLVDDEPVVLDLLEDVLCDSGFRVSRAVNGAQALERLQAEAFDAVLIDLKMPDMDGRQLFHAVQERWPDLARRVVFTTGDLDRPDLGPLLAEARATLLPKPFELEHVAETFRLVAAGEAAAG